MFSIAAQSILAAMISIIPPGKSVHSRIKLDYCDTDCQEQKVCTLPSILCAPPKFSPEIYNNLYNHNLFLFLSKEEQDVYNLSTKWQSYTVAETYEEGLKRYKTIAIAVERVVKNSDFWPGNKKELQDSLITVMGFESGFREDIHAGRGPLGRGDCKWKNKVNRSVKAFTKGATPVMDTCRSVCLGQINIGGEVRFGYRASDLVGSDLASTTRCVEVSGRMLAKSRNMCSGKTDYRGDWVSGMFSAYGTGSRCQALTGTGATLAHAWWPKARANKFQAIRNRSWELGEKEKRALGLL